jgi:4-aminobutyrate aminotransferase-like enzyme
MSLVKRAQKVLMPVLSHATDLEVVRGEGVYLIGKDGKKYLDFACGIAVTGLGHCPKEVVKAAQKQMKTLIHNCAGITYTEANIKFAEELVKVTPKGLDKVFLCQSGTESIEGALKLARYVTKKPGLVGFKGGFHGRTFGSLSLTSSKEKYRKGYEPFLPETYIIEPTLEAVKQLDLSKIAGMVIEPIMGEGGYKVHDKVFISGLRQICDENKIVLIFDEVQTGFGRTGKMFCCEHFGVTPDVLCLSKCIAAGFPLGAIVTKKELSDQWTVGAHGGTFTGNLVSCAAGTAAIQTIKKQKLVAKAASLGKYLKGQLAKIAQKDQQTIKDVRGLGLMIGVEFHAPEVAKQVQKKCLTKGLVLITCGPKDEVIRVIPPLIVTKLQIDQALKIFAKALEEK